MDYKDAIEYLRIAENAYNVEAFSESAEILEKVALSLMIQRIFLRNNGKNSRTRPWRE